MIRRWSSLITINSSLRLFKHFTQIKVRRVFRSAVKFRKFSFNKTYFKRRHIRKLKHKTSWLIFYNILKYWTDDCRFAKQHARFQYKNRFFVNNFIIINGNQFIRHQGRLFSTQDQWVSSSLTRSFFITLGLHNSAYLLTGYKHAHQNQGFFLTNEPTETITTTFTIATFDLQLFPQNFENDELYKDPFFFLDFELNLIINQISQIYYITINFWYFQLFKNK